MLLPFTLLISPVWALRLDVEPTLASIAEGIVLAEVTGTETRWTDEATLETAVFLTPLEVFAGRVEEDLEVRLPGGERGDLRMVVEDTPILVQDSRYLLYLIRDEEGLWRVLEGGAHAVGSAPPPYALTGGSWAHEQEPVEQGFMLDVDSFPESFGDPGDIEDAVLESMSAWNFDGDVGVVMRYGGVDSGNGSRNDDEFSIHYEDMYRLGSSTLAISTYWLSGGRYSECDMAFYGANLSGDIDWSTDSQGAERREMDFSIVAIHEMGHCLGLGHSSDRQAIMFSTAKAGTGPEDRHLHEDDIEGIQYLYGVGEPELSLIAYSVIDEDDDSVGAPEETLEILATVEEQGEGSASQVVAFLAASEPLSDAASEPFDLLKGAQIEFSLVTTVAADCVEDTTFEVELVLEDDEGHVWTEPIELTVACAAYAESGVDTGLDAESASTDEDPELVGGVCACGVAGVAGGLVWPLAVLGVGWRRRRD